MSPTEFYKNLADDIRLKSILLIAEEGELCVCELMVALEESSQPKISRHLALLKNSGVLVTRKQKQWVFYAINPELAAWSQQVINLTAQDNKPFLADSLGKLSNMGERPERVAACCG